MDKYCDEAHFAAHAPEEIPEWFVSPLEEAIPTRPEPPVEIKDAALSWARDPVGSLSGLYESYPGKSDRDVKMYPERCFCAARDYEEAMSVYWTDARAIEQKNIITRYFAWRWYYAARMLEFRGKV